MIRKLQRKFIAVLSGAVTVLLAALLIGLYLSNVFHYRQAGMDTLRNAVMEGERGHSAVPVTVVETGPGGRVLVLQNQPHFMTDDDISGAVAAVQKLQTETGALSEQNVRFFCIEVGPGRTRYAFAGLYGEQASLRAQAVSSAVIGILGALGALAFSIFLSKWITRPVQEAWDQQHQFVADASHELKTPLTVALSNVDMVISAEDQSPEVQGIGGKNRRRLELTRAELLRMKDLVEKLLALARADVDKNRPKAEVPLLETDLSETVDRVVSLFEPVFFETGRQLMSEVVPSCRVMGREKELSELLAILLDNASKYSFPNSNITLRLFCENRGRHHLTVENEGAGIPQKDLHRIFDRFFRADESRGETPGYGLGLSIAKEIADSHGGKIWAESSGGHTVFHVMLPAAKAGRE